MACSTATSKFAFLVIMLADFPPNSKVILFSFYLCAICISFNPTSVDPVNAILSILGWHAKYSPIYAGHGTTFNTPSGNPASLNISANLNAVRGV